MCIVLFWVKFQIKEFLTIYSERKQNLTKIDNFVFYLLEGLINFSSDGSRAVKAKKINWDSLFLSKFGDLITFLKTVFGKFLHPDFACLQSQ